MSTNLAVISDTPKRSLIAEMAARYGMEPKAFADTLRATVIPREASNEEFAAFLVVAREYNLNPLTKEIYAFPKKGGGIQPIVPIDGWTNIINSHKALDGIEFDDHHDNEGKLTAITCRLWRKDRSKPIVVTEYMSECVRGTDTWRQWPHRMLRHKALIQCARYAFSFAGIVDPDEAERMGASPMRDVTSSHEMQSASRKAPPPPPIAGVASEDVQDAPATAPEAEPVDGEVIPPQTSKAPPPPAAQAQDGADDLEIPASLRRPAPQKTTASTIPNCQTDPDGFVKWAFAKIDTAADPDALADLWETEITPRTEGLFPPDQTRLRKRYSERMERIG